jgi:hypothetical protein
MRNTPEIGALRVWHVPQVPGKAFHVSVASPKEAKKILDTLANYDLFQLKHRIKPDYCNAGGLERYDAGNGDGEPGWCEWCDEETGESIDEVEFA